MLNGDGEDAITRELRAFAGIFYNRGNVLGKWWGNYTLSVEYLVGFVGLLFVPHGNLEESLFTTDRFVKLNLLYWSKTIHVGSYLRDNCAVVAALIIDSF